MIHPEKDDNGHPVKIYHPDSPHDPAHWSDSSQHAATVPGHNNLPSKLHNVPTNSFKAPQDWRNIHGQGDFHEPLMTRPEGKRSAVGSVIVEPDHRVWVVHPTNQFGGYHATFPKGGVEYGLNSRENAIKETHEESGLKVKLHDHLGDFDRTTSRTRYYLAHREAGNPADMGWESQKVSLVPMRDLHKVVTHPADQPIIAALHKKYGLT